MGVVQQRRRAPAASRSAEKRRKLQTVLKVDAATTPTTAAAQTRPRGRYCSHLTRKGTPKLRSVCREPECGGGTAYCKHGVRRSRCRNSECGGGGAYCEHGVRRSRCRNSECGGGGAYCKHGVERSFCRNSECGGGGAYCEHKKRKLTCATCVTAGTSKLFCSICFSTRLSPFRLAAGRTDCAGCDKSRPPRVEHVFRTLLISKLPPIFTQPSAADDVLFGGESGCDQKRHRPDLLWICHEGKFAVEVEIDENAHENITPTCDLARVSRLYDSITRASAGTVNDVVFIRVAVYNGGDQIEKLSDLVAEKIKSLTDEACSFPKGTGAPILIYLNYDKTSEAIDHVAEATSGFGADGVVVL